MDEEANPQSGKKSPSSKSKPKNEDFEASNDNIDNNNNNNDTPLNMSNHQEDIQEDLELKNNMKSEVISRKGKIILQPLIKK